MTERDATLATGPGFEPPAGFECDRLEAQGGTLRYAVWSSPPTEQTRGTVVLLHGLSEQIEKYYRVIDALLQRGFAVAMMDLRCHGRSDNEPPGCKDIFAVYDDDFKRFVETVVLDKMPRPYIGMGHSTGGCVVTCAAHDHAEWFQGVILSAPMYGIRVMEKHPYLKHVANLLERLPYKQNMLKPSKAERFTSDLGRFNQFQGFLDHNYDLRPRLVMVDWLGSANRRLAKMNSSGWFKQIETPFLLCIAGEDKLVSIKAIENAALEMENAEAVRIGYAWHEILMEKESVQAPFWESADAFLAKHAPDASKPPEPAAPTTPEPAASTPPEPAAPATPEPAAPAPTEPVAPTPPEPAAPTPQEPAASVPQEPAAPTPQEAPSSAPPSANLQGGKLVLDLSGSSAEDKDSKKSS